MTDPCQQLAGRCVARPLGLLEPAQAQELDRHLESCQACQALHGDAAAAVAGLRLPDAAPPADAWERLQRRLAGPSAPALRVVLGCTFCHDELARAQAIYCASCLAPHHRECFQEHGRCAAPGCEAPSFVEARGAAARPTPSRREWPWILALGLSGTVAAAALSLSGGPELPRTALAPPRPAPPPLPGADELPAPAATPPVEEVRRVSLEAHDQPLPQAAREVARQAGRTVVVAPEVTARLTLSLADRPWPDAVAAIASATNTEVTTLPGGALVLQRPQPRLVQSFRDVDVRVALRQIASQAQRSLVLSPHVHGRLTTAYQGEDWVRALQGIGRAMGLRVAWKDDVLLVTGEGDDAGWGWTDLAAFADEPWSTKLVVNSHAPRFSLTVEETDLAAVVERVAAAANRTVFLTPAALVGSPRLSLDLVDCTLDDALRLVAGLVGCRPESLPGDVYLLDRPARVTHAHDAGPDASLSEGLRGLAEAAGGAILLGPGLDRDGVSWSLSSAHSQAAVEAIAVAAGFAGDERLVGPQRHSAEWWNEPWSIGPLLDLDLQDVSLREACARIGRVVGERIEVAPSIDARVTARLRHAPWQSAVAVLARLNGCRVELRRPIVKLTRPALTSVRLCDADLRTVVPLLATVAGQNVTVAPEVTGRVSCTLGEVDPLAALRHLIESAGGFGLEPIGPGSLCVTYLDEPRERGPGPVWSWAPETAPPPAPPAESGGEGLALNVSGIGYSAADPRASWAIVNDVALREGEPLIDPATGEPIPDLVVDRILPAAVELTHGAERIVRSLRQP